ncbi:hypothetical protein MDOR_08070 [Mycolicibacterium doricum]|uniref:Uncharacterized protein n=1 Tax=Mycolicibacterium doricum TaxID=126673 RepID=A0A7I7VT67_9MYCO|nr:hypothetical protein MDOR_08070 [Mycolicibacterium doricum]
MVSRVIAYHGTPQGPWRSPASRPSRPVVQPAPPLISGQPEFDAIYDVLQGVLSEAARRL